MPRTLRSFTWSLLNFRTVYYVSRGFPKYSARSLSDLSLFSSHEVQKSKMSSCKDQKETGGRPETCISFLSRKPKILDEIRTDYGCLRSGVNEYKVREGQKSWERSECSDKGQYPICAQPKTQFPCRLAAANSSFSPSFAYFLFISNEFRLVVAILNSNPKKKFILAYRCLSGQFPHSNVSISFEMIAKRTGSERRV